MYLLQWLDPLGWYLFDFVYLVTYIMKHIIDANCVPSCTSTMCLELRVLIESDVDNSAQHSSSSCLDGRALIGAKTEFLEQYNSLSFLTLYTVHHSVHKSSLLTLWQHFHSALLVLSWLAVDILETFSLRSSTLLMYGEDLFFHRATSSAMPI